MTSDTATRGDDVPVVDVHNHAIPQGFVERVRTEGERFGYRLIQQPQDRPSELRGDAMYPGESEFIQTPGGGMSDLRPRRIDEGVRLAELADAGITIICESLTPKVTAYEGDDGRAEWAARAMNDGLLENQQQHPDRVVAFGHVPLHHPKVAAAEVERVADLGMRGLQIASSVNDRNLDDPALEPFWRAADEAGLFLFVHPAPIIAHNAGIRTRLASYHLVNVLGNPFETSLAFASLLFGGVFDRHPGLRFAFAHAGGFVPWIRGRLWHTYKVRTEAAEQQLQGAFDDYLEHVWFDTITHEPDALRFLLETVGPANALHGTDYAADMGDWHQISTIERLPGISPDERAAILGGNACRLLRILD